MKFAAWITMWASLVSLTVWTGCAPSDSQEPGSQTNAASETPGDSDNTDAVTPEDVAEETREAVDAAGQLAEQTKDEYVEQLDEDLAALDEKVEELEQRAESLKADAVEEWQQSRDDLRQRREQLQEELDELKSASGDAWLDLRDGTTAAWDELQKAFDKAGEHFSENDADNSETQTDGESSSS